MPLNSTLKLNQKQSSANTTKEQGKLTNRSTTPQPPLLQTRGRDRPLPGLTSRHNRSNSHNGFAQLDNHPVDPTSLKLPVKDTFSKSASNIPQGQPGFRSRLQDVTAKRTVLQPQKPRTSVLDDTLTSIHMDDTTSFTNNEYVAMGPLDHPSEPNQPHDPLARSSKQHWTFTRQSRPHEAFREPELGSFEDTHWMATVDRERKLQGQEPKYVAFHGSNEPGENHAGNDTYNFDDDDDEDEYPQERPQWIDTPSRLQPAFEPQAGPLLKKRTTQDQSNEPASPPLPPLKELRHDPVLEISLGNPHQDPSNVNHRFKDRRDHAAHAVESEATAFLAPRPPQQDISSKVSSYPEESSSEEDQGRIAPDKSQQVPTSALAPSPRGTKRPRDLDMDFSPSTLAHKSFDDLDAIPFWLDPTAEEALPAVDAHGNTMALPAKLHNLSKMQVQDQTALFRSQTDSDREATAGWFLERIRDEMLRLMRVRVERRKVALRFEMEVKRRDSRVRSKIADVDEELEGLKKGGSTLIAGRTKPSR